MRFKLTLLLLLANLAVFFLLWRLNQPPEIVARPAGPIPIENFDIDHIVIDDHAQNEVREIKRDQRGVWHLIKPVEWLASEDAERDLINHLQFLEEETNFSLKDLEKSGQALKDFGLDKPAVEITVQAGSQTAKLLIGRHTNDGSRLYVMNPADGLVRVVAQELLATLDKPVQDLRDSNLFTLSFYEIQSLAIGAGGTGTTPTSSFTRFVRDGYQWRMDTPFSCAADEDLVKKAISKLENLHVESFIPPTDAADLARFGLAAPSLKIELKGDAAESSQTLWLGKKVPDATEPEYYAKLADRPAVFVVRDTDVFATLLDAQNALRERQFMNISPEKVSSISVDSADSAEVRMQMAEDHTWQVRDKDATGAFTFIAADPGIIQAMINDLAKLSAKSFVSDAPTNDDLEKTFNLKSPQWKIILQEDKTAKPVMLDIGISTATTPVRYFAKIEGVDSVYEIDSDILSQLSSSPLHYRDRTLEKLPAGAQVVSLKLALLKDNDLTAGEEVFNYSLDAIRPTWDEYLKNKPELVRDNVQVLLDALRQFTVEDYLQAYFDEHYQMTSTASIEPPSVSWRYRLDAGVQLSATRGVAASTETLTFYFSDRSGALQLGGTREPPLPPAVFTLPINVRGALGVILREQAQPAAAVEALREINQPINPGTITPVFAPGAATAPPASGTILPTDAVAPIPAPAASSSSSAP